MAATVRILVSVAEQSADEHAAAMIGQFAKLYPQAEFTGLAGPALRQAGCGCIHDMTARSAMALAAFRRIPEGWAVLRRLKALLASEQFDAAVVVDSPALNLPVARLCRRAGLPVLYYIAPQTWAWGPRGWRNRRVKRSVDRLACIWPFEEEYFRRAGIRADYVGHPSFDHLIAEPVDQAAALKLKSDATPLIALLPGSRRHVIEEVLPGQLAVAAALHTRYPRAAFMVVAAHEELLASIDAAVESLGRALPLRILCGPADRAAAIVAADLALVASGTVTLEVAYRATPMLVMYNTNRWTYRLVGRWLISTPHLSIPNILAGRRIVPEFMPYYRSVDPIIAAAVEWLSTPGKLARIRQDLEDVVRPIAKAGAAARVAGILAEMLVERGVIEPAAPAARPGKGGPR